MYPVRHTTEIGEITAGVSQGRVTVRWVANPSRTPRSVGPRPSFLGSLLTHINHVQIQAQPSQALI